MSVTTSRVARLVLVTGLSAAAALGSAGAASAGNQSNLVAQVACDTTTGHQVITWTFTYTYPTGPGVIDSAVVDATGLTGGSTIDTSATMSPSTGLQPLDTSVGTTHASGDAVGSYKLTVSFTPPQAPQQFASYTIGLDGGCVATTTTAPATTAAPTTVPATVGSTIPAGGTTLPDTTSTSVAGAGGLPGTGGTSPALPIIGATLMAVGGALLLARRRVTP